MKKSERPEDGPACRQCGQTNRADRSFCRKCGLHLNPKPITRSSSPEPGSYHPKRRRPPKPVSDRKRAERPERAAVIAAAFHRDGYQCQARARVPEIICAGPLDPHEIIPRSAWAAGYLVLDNVISVCRAHHDWTEEHREQDGPAHRVGLHGFSWERPDYQAARQ